MRFNAGLLLLATCTAAQRLFFNPRRDTWYRGAVDNSIPRTVFEKVNFLFHVTLFPFDLCLAQPRAMAEEEQRRKLDRLKAVRRGHRGVLTKLTREVDEIVSEAEEGVCADPTKVSRLNVIYEQFDAKMKVFSNLDGEIVLLCPVEEIEGEIEDSESIIAKIIEAKRKIDSSLKGNADEHVRSLPSTGPSDHSTVNRPRLPKLTLAKFRGDVTTWSSFWDSYKAAVHENADIMIVDKFNYLNSLLEGPAARTIQGLKLNEANYNSAVKLLQERFGKPQHIISAHMEELIKIPPCSGDRPAALRFVYNKINVNIRGLASMGIDSGQYGSLLIPVIMTKLPQDLRLHVARETDKEVWEIDELMSLLRKEVEAREATEMIKLHQVKNPINSGFRNPPQSPPTAAALLASGLPVRCVYCHEAHYSASCTKFQTPQARKEILLKSGRCFNCLKANHKSKECESLKTCGHCKRKHHQSICDKANVNDSNLADGQVSKNTHNNDGTPTSTNTTNVSKNRQVILLQTAHAMASATAGGTSVPVRVLFDNGSQLSCHRKATMAVKS